MHALVSTAYTVVMYCAAAQSYIIVHYYPLNSLTPTYICKKQSLSVLSKLPGN